jgi:hypothetical protein
MKQLRKTDSEDLATHRRQDKRSHNHDTRDPLAAHNDRSGMPLQSLAVHSGDEKEISVLIDFSN